ncbi:MAG: hypothetical protein ACLU38_15955 [Dysosmobacter sp.]
MKIQDLRAREIIDCKGKPLLEVDIITEMAPWAGQRPPPASPPGTLRLWSLRDGDQRPL